MLVDHAKTILDGSVDGDRFARFHNNNIIMSQALKGDFNLYIIAKNPDEARLFAESMEQHFARISPRFLEQLPPQTQTPRHERTGKYLAGCKAAC